MREHGPAKPERFEKLRKTLLRAMDLPAARREAYVAEACSGDPELQAEVEAKLAHLGKTRAILKSAGLDEVIADAALTVPTRSAGEEVSRVGSVISHYRIEKRLGAGGMGEVYLAHDRALDRRVALKVLAPGFSSSIRERLLREAWTSSRVQHPAITTFYEAGRADGIDFIAMEYVDGKTLREELRSGPLGVKRAREIMGTVLEGLVHAHFSGILHRDIKPDNIMIAASGAVKLLDFGLAKGLLMEGDAEGGEEPRADTGLPAEQVSDDTLAADATRGVPSIDGLGPVGGNAAGALPEISCRLAGPG